MDEDRSLTTPTLVQKASCAQYSRSRPQISSPALPSKPSSPSTCHPRAAEAPFRVRGTPCQDPRRGGGLCSSRRRHLPRLHPDSEWLTASQNQGRLKSDSPFETTVLSPATALAPGVSAAQKMYWGERMGCADGDLPQPGPTTGPEPRGCFRQNETEGQTVILCVTRGSSKVSC